MSALLTPPAATDDAPRRKDPTLFDHDLDFGMEVDRKDVERIERVIAEEVRQLELLRLQNMARGARYLRSALAVVFVVCTVLSVGGLLVVRITSPDWFQTDGMVLMSAVVGSFCTLLGYVTGLGISRQPGE